MEENSPQRRSSSSLINKFLPGIPTSHKMDQGRRVVPINYAESEASTPAQSPYTPKSSQYIELGQEETEEIEFATPKRSARSGLRKPKPNTSLKAIENAYTTPKRIRNKKRTALEELMEGDLAVGHSGSSLPQYTARNLIRQEIAAHTVATRDQFLIQKKDLWLPLLPEEHNYVKKIVEKHNASSAEDLAKLPTITPYEEIETQPRGITATMKPYQLSGLSFMMYLHRNGLSGILGDEMGLGKTLQTLSLIQHLKENDPRDGIGRQQRPFLVICPLSVLSSWMAEARKWAPNLKVIRFHGPIKERERLKKVVAGELDFHGNLTAQAKAKVKARNKAAKKTSKLDSDPEDEEEDDNVGVDLVVTTYDSYRVEQHWFKKAFVWRYCVLDEGHTVKNHESLVSKSLQGLQAEYRLILTGTPLQNNLSELWSLLHWLYSEVFTDKTKDLFDQSFNLSKGHYSNTVVDDARHLLELIMLRRMKTSPGVDLNLPPKTEVLLFVPLAPMQIFWYRRMITKADKGLIEELFKDAKGKEEQALSAVRNDEELLKQEAEALQILQDPTLIGSDKWKETKEILAQTLDRERNGEAGPNTPSRKSDWQKLMNLLMQLRKVCNHPYQIQNAEPDPYESGEHVVTASGKFMVLDKLLNELVLKQKKKILIFSGFTKMLDLVEELLYLRGGDGSSFRSVRIDGATARARRNLGIRMFNDLESNYRVMLISTRAGGLGINLATASDVVLLDQDWNPQITLQAEARAHRIGQKNPVTIYKLVSQGTVEEQMMGRIQKKLYLSAKVTEAMEDIHTKFGSGRKKGRKGFAEETDDNMPQLNTGQLMSLVRRGASAISRPQVDIDEMASWDWETTVANCKDQPADMNVKREAIPDAKIDEEAERSWLTGLERVQADIFDGKKLNKAKTNKEVAAELYETDRADRRVGKNTTVMVDGFAISKESMNCAEWEAVPTFAGKDARLAEPKRAKKAKIEPQSHCQVCFDGGELHLCQACPRAYHAKCLDVEFQAKAKGWSFNCPQHECHDCSQKTTDAGGMLYRCRWCERAFCEDCMDFDKAVLVGNTLIEYENLGYGEAQQAFYIECMSCVDHFELVPDDKNFCAELEHEFEKEHAKRAADMAEAARLEAEQLATVAGAVEMSRAGSLTDATTVETPGIGTPGMGTPDAPIVVDDDEDDEDFEIVPTKKRKLKSKAPSPKRMRGIY